MTGTVYESVNVSGIPLQPRQRDGVCVERMRTSGGVILKGTFCHEVYRSWSEQGKCVHKLCHDGRARLSEQ